MQEAEYLDYHRRADQATSVHELREIGAEAKRLYPNDADADAIDSTCFMYAATLIQREVRRRPGPTRGASASASCMTQ